MFTEQRPSLSQDLILIPILARKKRAHNITFEVGGVQEKNSTFVIKKVLTMEKVWAFERRTRDYCRLYGSIAMQIESHVIKREDVDYSMLEKQRSFTKPTEILRK